MEDTVYPIIKHHYDMLRDDVSKVIKKLDRELAFYRFYFDSRVKGVEIIYDTPTDLLSSAGIVLSKQFENGKAFFKVRKLSYLPTELRKPSSKFYLAECSGKETPKDYPIQIASAINNAFSNVFTIDLVEVVKQTIPRYEIKVKGEFYTLTSGTGMKGSIMFENATYKDFSTGRKVKKKGATVALPSDPAFKKEVEEVLDAIERKCKELFPYNESRFEIAQRVLRPKRQTGPKLSRKEMKEKLKNQNEQDQNEA